MERNSFTLINIMKIYLKKYRKRFFKLDKKKKEYLYQLKAKLNLKKVDNKYLHISFKKHKNLL